MATRKISPRINLYLYPDSDIKKRGYLSTRALSIILTYLILGEEEEIEDGMAEDVSDLISEVMDTAEEM